MKKGTIIGLAVTIPLGLACCAGTAVVSLAAALTGNGQQQTTTTAAMVCGTSAPAAPVSTKAAPGWSLAQTNNAAIIVRVGQQMNVPPRGWVIAVATAMQESDLINSSVATDHDSVGLFQQRPSQGWGTVAQIMDQAYSSRKFYERLLQVRGWQGMSLTAAAQAVQRSAFPNAYAKHEQKAADLVNRITGGGANQAGVEAGRCTNPGEVSAAGWTQPLTGTITIVSGFRTPDRPTHNGVDLAASKHTAVHAVSAGTVIVSRCDPATAATVAGGCNADGSMSAKGCGWYVDVAHAGGIISRYCHMISQPLVKVGDQVTAGQQIGWSGTSGNSSGPHLHFEVHHNNDDRGATGAIDPVPFMREHGAPLGGAK